MENDFSFRTFGTMLDCSRNAVPNIRSLKKWIDLTAGLGYNALLLYTEDTYEVPGEPYFGYMRGRFTQDELREADRYALSRGMTLIPCIQVLAHLNQIKRWPAYKSHFDIHDILLIGDDRIYDLIDHMFASIASCFTCRTLHIGMDEAHAVGRGRYMDKHGESDRTKIMIEHLARVCRIGEKYGFRFIMWSDMFFRLASGGSYYNAGAGFSDEIRALIPENVELVYWDYYSAGETRYDQMIEAHERLHPGTWFAGGLWSWTGFAPHNAYSILTTKAALQSCARHGVKDVFLTLWGDNGAECSRFSLLPSLFYTSELVRGITDEEVIRQHFAERFNISFDDFMLLDLPGTRNAEEGFHCNQDKYALYNDCFMGLLDTIIPEGCGMQYGTLAERLDHLSATPEWGYLFDTLSALCRVLEIKTGLGKRTHAAYLSGDTDTLSMLPAEYDALLERLEVFHRIFRKQWFLENKPHGFDVQDIRLGGLAQRLKSCRDRLRDLACGRIDRIEELEDEQLDPYGGGGPVTPPTISNWLENVTANTLLSASPFA